MTIGKGTSGRVSTGTGSTGTGSAAPIARPELVARIARAALELAAGPGAVRVAVDGPVTEDARGLAGEIVAAIAAVGRPAAGVHAEDFLRARSLRLEYGTDAEAYYQRWYDLAALRREVLDPVDPDGPGRYLPRLRDPRTDRPYRDPAVAAPPGLVLVVDGRFLADWDLAGAFDLTVLLEVSPAALARRLPDAEREPVAGAWRRYLDDCDPAGRADLVVRFDHPDRPALVGSP
ncbi:MAG TPA: hypothetical protein VFP72_08690 [Kineosporiaceae bacterium]|nr:hypothetical protein [Kineosporiaceae bacterium]